MKSLVRAFPRIVHRPFLLVACSQFLRSSHLCILPCIFLRALFLQILLPTLLFEGPAHTMALPFAPDIFDPPIDGTCPPLYPTLALPQSQPRPRQDTFPTDDPQGVNFEEPPLTAPIVPRARPCGLPQLPRGSLLCPSLPRPSGHPPLRTFLMRLSCKALVVSFMPCSAEKGTSVSPSWRNAVHPPLRQLLSRPPAM